MIQDLLNDPQTIPFVNSNKINMGLLKKDIDRRILKIRSMLGGGSSKVKCHKQIQTGQIQQQGFASPYQHILQYMSPNSSALKVKQLPDQNRNYGKRCSLPVSKIKHKKQESIACTQDKKYKSKLSSYLSIRKKLQNCMGQSDQSQEKKQIQNAQDDKIFTSEEFNRLSGFRHSQNINDFSHHFHIPLAFNDSDQEAKRDCSESSNSFIYHRKSSNLGNKAPSVKKIRFTDRTAPDYEKRFVISEECRMKVLQQVQNLTDKKRKQGKDYKLRDNVIKKIDEKFSEYYDNI